MGMSRLDFAPFTRAWHPIIGGCFDGKKSSCLVCTAIKTANRRGFKFDHKILRLISRNLTNPLTATIGPEDLILVSPASDMFGEIMVEELGLNIVDFCLAAISLSNARFVIRTTQPLNACAIMKSPNRSKNVLAWRLMLAPESEDTFVWPLPNLMIGAMATSNAEVEEALRILPKVPCVLNALFISPVSTNILDNEGFDNIDWIMLGGDVVYGKDFLIQNPSVARTVRDIATDHSIDFHFSTWGDSANALKEPGCYEQRVGSSNFAYIDGVSHHSMPDFCWYGNGYSGKIPGIQLALSKIKSIVKSGILTH